MAIEVITGNVYDVLGTIKDKSVNCCVTSPPYWNLRDYGTGEWDGGNPDCDHIEPQCGPSVKQESSAGTRQIQYKHECRKCGAIRVDGQLGSEKLHDCLGWATGDKCGECYVCHMVEVFRGAKRVLRDDGILWVNLGDSYSGSMKGICADGRACGGEKQRTNQGSIGISQTKPNWSDFPLKNKDLCGIPWRFALAMQADGWWLRRDVVWEKPNAMCESVTDRPTTSHEYIFMFTKSDRYYYDCAAIAEPVSDATVDDLQRRKNPGQHDGATKELGKSAGLGAGPRSNGKTRNKRSVWDINTRPFPGSHFAVFPYEIPHICVSATCPPVACAECGSPWERIVHTGNSEHHCRPGCGCGADQKHGNQNWQAGWQKYGNYNNTAIATDEFKPTCDCNADTVAGTVLDPFSGAGTTGVVCRDLGLDYIGIELNPEYAQMSRDRIADPDYEKKLRTHQRVERENKEQGSLFDV